MKSKNFTAAEKHFAKKEERYRKTIKSLEEENKRLRCELHQSESLTKSLQSDIEHKDEWIRRLLTYTELPLDDIKAACEKDKRMASMLGFWERMFTGRM